MPFAAFMQLALYDQRRGYYSAGAQRTGWRGHFVTSPELDPSFGALWAVAFEEVWHSCGTPEAFEVVEIGPGEGSFAASVLASVGDDFRAALTYRMVERTPAVRERQKERLQDGGRVVWTESVTELPDIPAGVVFANEILDNLPVHLVGMQDGEIVEVMVGCEDDGLVLLTRPPSNPELELFLERNGMTLSEGGRVEVTLAAESMIGRIGRTLTVGAVIFIDYGLTADELALREGGTLVSYSRTGADTEVLVAPGEKDITSHANWTSVTNAMVAAGLRPEGPTPQREVLHRLGARALDASLKEDYATAIAEGRGGDAVGVLSRRQALGALLDPGGLGGLQVICGITDGLPPLSIFR